MSPAAQMADAYAMRGVVFRGMTIAEGHLWVQVAGCMCRVIHPDPVHFGVMVSTGRRGG